MGNRNSTLQMVTIEAVRPSRGGLVCLHRVNTLSTLIQPNTSSSTGVGRYFTDVAKALVEAILHQTAFKMHLYFFTS